MGNKSFLRRTLDRKIVVHSRKYVFLKRINHPSQDSSLRVVEKGMNILKLYDEDLGSLTPAEYAEKVFQETKDIDYADNVYRAFSKFLFWAFSVIFTVLFFCFLYSFSHK